MEVIKDLEVPEEWASDESILGDIAYNMWWPDVKQFIKLMEAVVLHG